MATTPHFSDTVEPHHHRLTIDDADDVYVVGDVHGSRSALESLLATLDLGDDGIVVFVGDLVRKGPDSPGVVDLVRDDDRLLSVRGNNEQKILRGDKTPDWLRAGDRAYFESLPVAISFAECLVVHGGVDPDRPLDEHTAEDLLTMRAPRGDRDVRRATSRVLRPHRPRGTGGR
jgi:serine/threonine protein phosphatase 1